MNASATMVSIKRRYHKEEVNATILWSRQIALQLIAQFCSAQRVRRGMFAVAVFTASNDERLRAFHVHLDLVTAAFGRLGRPESKEIVRGLHISN
jgi:hypothetical protein